MDLVLTDKGRQYLERLFVNADEMWERWDMAMLKYIDEESSDEGLQERVGTAGTKVIRRLFEEGYISY